MITEEKLKIYKRYKGDIDSWARSGSRKEKLKMVDNDWYLIDGLIQDLSSSERGLVSLEFTKTLNNRLEEICDGVDTINQLKELIQTDW